MSSIDEAFTETMRQVVREEVRAALAEQKAPSRIPTPARLSVMEAAALAHKHPDTIRRAIKGKDLRATKPRGSREWVVSGEDFDRWITGASLHPLDMASEVDKAVARVRR